MMTNARTKFSYPEESPGFSLWQILLSHESVEFVANALGIEFIGFHYIAAETIPCEFDEKLGEFQFRNLVEHERWLSDTEARKVLEKQACDYMRDSIQIIYINGPSSSGKTTLAKSLQQEFDQPFLHIGIDRVIGMMPEKINSLLQ